MQSSRLVSLNNMLRAASIASIVLSSILLTNFVIWSAASYGFDIGYQTAKAEFKKAPTESEIIFIVGERSSYQQLSYDYSYLAFWTFGVLVIGCLRIFVKIKDIAMVISILSSVCLVAIIKSLWFQIGLKDASSSSLLDSPYNVLLMQSAPYDWISLYFSFALLLVEAILFLEWFQTRKKV